MSCCQVSIVPLKIPQCLPFGGTLGVTIYIIGKWIPLFVPLSCATWYLDEVPRMSLCVVIAVTIDDGVDRAREILFAARLNEEEDVPFVCIERRRMRVRRRRREVYRSRDGSR